MKQQKSINSMIAFEIRSLVQKIQSYLDESDKTTMAGGLLVTAAYLIDQPSIPDHESDPEDVDLPDIDSDPESESEPSGEPPSRRNLAKEWSGPLPKRSTVKPANPSKSSKPSKKRPKIDSVNGMSGGEPEDYETLYDVAPNNLCGACNGPIDSHPLDKNKPRLKDGREAYIICDRTRVYV